MSRVKNVLHAVAEARNNLLLSLENRTECCFEKREGDEGDSRLVVQVGREKEKSYR